MIEQLLVTTRSISLPLTRNNWQFVRINSRASSQDPFDTDIEFPKCKVFFLFVKRATKKRREKGEQGWFPVFLKVVEVKWCTRRMLMLLRRRVASCHRHSSLQARTHFDFWRVRLCHAFQSFYAGIFVRVKKDAACTRTVWAKGNPLLDGDQGRRGAHPHRN